MDYYIWLPSNVESAPHNTKANYRTRLFNPIKFNNLEYECAIVETFTPPFDKQITKMVLTKTVLKGADVTSEYTFTPEDLKVNPLTKINLALGIMANEVGIIPKTEPEESDADKLAEIKSFLVKNTEASLVPDIRADIVLDKIEGKSNNSVEGQVRIEEWQVGQIGKTHGFFTIRGLPDGSFLQMYGDICKMFQYVPGQKLMNHATSVIDDILFIPESTLFYIYSDVIEQQHVGDSFLNLLGVIRVPYKQGCHNDFANPTYVPVNTDELEWIQITIKDDSDSLIKFTNTGEKTLIKLHFRPRRYGF